MRIRRRTTAADNRGRTVLAHLAVLTLALAPAAAAQDLVTDRPDQTESSVTVARGQWQIETGWTLTRDEADGLDVEVHELPGTLVRVGVASAWELRIGWSGWVREEIDSGALSGVEEGAGDGELGAKVFLRPERGGAPEIALLFGSSVPVGDDAMSSERFDPSFRFSFAHTLSDRLSLGYNLGMEWETSEVGSGGQHTLSRGIYTVALGIGLGERLGAFVELYGDVGLSDDGSPAHAFNGGFTWLLNDTLQLDAAAGVGLSEAADDWFVGLGVSFRIPD